MITALTVLESGGVQTPQNLNNPSENLSLTQTATAITIEQGTGGNNLTLPAATSGTNGLAGLLDAARATIIDNLPQSSLTGQYGQLLGLPSLNWYENFIISGFGSVITTGQKGFLQVGVPFVITGWALYADAVGSIAVDIWKVPNLGAFPPTSANSITAGTPPTLTSAQNASSGFPGLLAWSTVTVNINDILAFNVISVATVKQVTLYLFGIHT